MLSTRTFAQSGTRVIPWIDQPAPIPPAIAENGLKNLTSWEELGGSWITPNNKFFSIAHYNRPQIDGKTWRLDLDGRVGQPSTLSLDQLRAMPRREITFTLECSSDNGFNFTPA
jgi:DMSO/TMAO reductase YedYZ molybdopterin-dependent catalytic subunit